MVGIGLKALRVKSPHVLAAAWRLALAASLLTLVVGRPALTLAIPWGFGRKPPDGKIDELVAPFTP